MWATAPISQHSASKLPNIKKQTNKQTKTTLGWGNCEKMLTGMKFASTEAHIYMVGIFDLRNFVICTDFRNLPSI